MATQFVPVELGNIERGIFLADVEKAFAKLQRDFVAHIDEHKVSGKAALTVGVEIHFKRTSAPNHTLDGNYGIITKIVPSLPNKPSGVTTAYANVDVEGNRTLFTQSAGTSKEKNPRQSIMQTPEGESVV